MRWMQGRRSSNIEDRRSARPAAMGGGGLLVAALLVWMLGGDPTALVLEGASRSFTQQLSPEQEQEQAEFVSVVLASTEDVWRKIFAQKGGAYQDPALVLYSGIVESGCGVAQAATGPFYCPLDNKAYLDMGFFYDLEHTLDAPGDFARAYVIAHEIGHHVQNLLGVTEKVANAQQTVSGREANALSVQLELNADCYAGIWGHYARADYQMLEPGDEEEALNAASQIGDDRLQQQGQGYAVPDSFTHGSSAQRLEWFRRGFASGDFNACDTFGVM